MKKVLILSLLSLMVCVSALTIGLDHFSLESREAAQSSLQYGLLAIAGGYGTTAAVAITLLSLLAVRPSPDGSFIIKRNSVYGRVFLSFAALRYQGQFSLCSAFWKTNLMLLVMSFLVGCTTFLAVVMYQAGLLKALIGIAYMLGVLLTIFAIMVVKDYLGEDLSRLEDTKPKTARVIRSAPVYVFFSILGGVCAIFVYTVGIGTIYVMFLAWAPWLAKWSMVAIGLITMYYVVYRFVGSISESPFGREFGLFWNKNLCPRIKIK